MRVERVRCGDRSGGHLIHGQWDHLSHTCVCAYHLQQVCVIDETSEEEEATEEKKKKMQEKLSTFICQVNCQQAN